MRLLFAVVSAFVLATGAAKCETVKSQVTAGNGVTVDILSDEFANEHDYSSPKISFTVGNAPVPSVAYVSKVKKAGVLGGLMIQGDITYTGEWRFYNAALFKGGDPAEYLAGPRDIASGSCSYGCAFIEGFQIKLGPADVAKHAENGVLAIEIRPTRGTETVLLQIPVSYIDAVNEVAK